MPVQNRLDFAQLNAEALHLNLVIYPPQKAYFAVGMVTDQVASFVNHDGRMTRYERICSIVIHNG